MPDTIRHGDVLAGRYRLEDLLSESGEGRFWRAQDRVLARPVAVHVIAADDARAPGLLEAARRSATVSDPHLLRVLDAEQGDGFCYVVNEWGTGTSLDVLLATEGPLTPRRAAWIVSEVADAVAAGHAVGVAHGRLVPENVLIDTAGSIRVIGYAVEAALHGLSPARRGSDLVDLVALLYAGLTGRWAGASRSEVPAAPEEAGRVLRPRQVRPGVPRPLDQLCDEVLNSHGTPTAGVVEHEARAIAELLRSFVGDPSALIAVEAAREHGLHRLPSRSVLPVNGPLGPVTGPLSPAPLSDPDVSPTMRVPLVEKDSFPQVAPDTEPTRRFEPMPASPPPAERPAERAAETPPAADPLPDPLPEPPSPADPVTELPTQAGMPIFDDEADDVSWLTARTEAPPPPPPFEDPPVRPLFAPDPPDGQPARRPRPGAAPTSGSGEFWPWGAEVSTGTGHSIAPFEEEADPEPLPGRRSLWAAALVGLGTLILVAVVIGLSLGKDTPFNASDDDPAPRATPSRPAPTPISGITATDFDPEGDPAEEYPERVPLILDGDPATTWITMTYKDQFAEGGYKGGVGVVLDLQEAQEVRSVEVRLVGAPTTLEAYLSDEAPADVTTMTPVAEGTSEGETLTLKPEKGASGRFLTLWLTRIPSVGAEFRGEIADVVVRG